jgi:C4-dicarboxylate transporter DctM subunit
MESFLDGLMSAMRTSCMIGFIIACAAVPDHRGGLRRHSARAGRVGRHVPAVILCAAVRAGVLLLILGCFLEGISIIVLTSSVMLPMVKAAGIDLLWFGIYIVILIEAAQITPPVGFNLFVLQSITGKDILTVTRAAMPYFLRADGAAGADHHLPADRAVRPADDALTRKRR